MAEHAEWGPGPWDEEPDEASWTDHATGLQCVMGRNRWGSWCGYVHVPLGHPWYSVDFTDLWPVMVHGDLSFGGFLPGVLRGLGWFVGFDCAHSYDLSPGMGRMDHSIKEVYCTYWYARRETEALALQVRQATRDPVPTDSCCGHNTLECCGTCAVWDMLPDPVLEVLRVTHREAFRVLNRRGQAEVILFEGHASKRSRQLRAAGLRPTVRGFSIAVEEWSWTATKEGSA